MLSPPTCTRALGLEVNYAGVSNQLIGLQNVLCMAEAARACAINLRPVGYVSGALHATRDKEERPLPVTALLRFEPWAQSALELGPTLAEDSEPTIGGKAPCQNASRSGGTCSVCHAYLSSPRGCLNNSFNRGATVWFDQAFNADPNKPRHHVARPCFGKDLREIAGVTPRVEAAAERLKRRLGLSDPYIAVQYRAGADWRGQDAERNTHACYGPTTIEAVLRAWAPQGTPPQGTLPQGTPPQGTAPPMRFVMTNAHGYATAAAHPQHPHPPAAERLIVESLVAARAEKLLLNPQSTIQSLIVRLRQLEGRPTRPTHLRFVNGDEVVDACTCKTTNAESAIQRQNHRRFCSRPEEFARRGAGMRRRSVEDFLTVDNETHTRVHVGKRIGHDVAGKIV